MSDLLNEHRWLRSGGALTKWDAFPELRNVFTFMVVMRGDKHLGCVLGLDLDNMTCVRFGIPETGGPMGLLADTFTNLVLHKAAPKEDVEKFFELCPKAKEVLLDWDEVTSSPNVLHPISDWVLESSLP